MTVEAVTVFLSRALVVSGDVRDDAHSDSNFWGYLYIEAVDSDWLRR